MKGPSWVVIGVTFFLEIIAFGLALGAMTRRSKATPQQANDQQSGYCIYTSDIATGLAAGAIILLFAGHAIIMGVTGCFCCGSGSYKGKARAWAIVAFSLAWFCFIIAELCLITGARLNKVHTDYRFSVMNEDDQSELTCKQVRKSVFATGACFTFLTLLFSELYYMALIKSSDGSWEQSYKNGAPTISMTAYP